MGGSGLKLCRMSKPEALALRQIWDAQGPGLRITGGYLEGQGDLVSSLIVDIAGVIIWFIGVLSILTKFP